MQKQLKNMEELFDYLMYGYMYQLEDVSTKKGIQKRLRDNELEQELKNKTKENVKVKDLFVELKLGPSYNRKESPWIQLFTRENKSGTRGRYVGISFSKETSEIELWVGFGRAAKKQAEIMELAKEYIIKYSLMEPDLKYGFEYIPICSDGIFIKKKISLNNFKEEQFQTELEYITDLYKAYEIRFENSPILLTESKDIHRKVQNQTSYEELNEKMLTLIEEVGNLAKAIKELRKK